MSYGNRTLVHKHIIQLDQSSFGYGRGALFEGLSLGLAPGNIYGLLGVNGAGKSTLLKLMSGLLFAGSGTVRSLGRDPAKREPSFLLDVFVLTEDAQAPSMQAGDYVRARAPFYPRFDPALFERHLREFEIPANGNLAALSHGQQKKFLLAFGLASQAKLVLLNSTLAEIGGRLHMTQQSSPPVAGTPDLLFSEPTIGGFWSVWRGGGDGPLDLEVLFNAIVAKPELARSIFAATGGAE